MSASFVGSYVVEGDTAESEHPIGPNVQVQITETSGQYKITAPGSANPIWHQFSGQLVGDEITGSIEIQKPQPKTLHFSIENVDGQAKVRCAYGVPTTEAGSWIADDEGVDP